jgi:hypothetical protein
MGRKNQQIALQRFASVPRRATGGMTISFKSDGPREKNQ